MVSVKEESTELGLRDVMNRMLVVSLPRLTEAAVIKPNCESATDVFSPEYKCPVLDGGETSRHDELPSELAGRKRRVTGRKKANSKGPRKDESTVDGESWPNSQRALDAGKPSHDQHLVGLRLPRGRQRKGLGETTNCDAGRNQLSQASASSCVGERKTRDKIQIKTNESNTCNVSKTVARIGGYDSDVEITDPVGESAQNDAADCRTIDLTTPPPVDEIHQISDSESSGSVVEVENIDDDDSDDGRDDIVWIVENGRSAPSLAAGGSGSEGVIDLTSSSDKLTLAIVDRPTHVDASSSSTSSKGRKNVNVLSSNPPEDLIDLTHGEMVVSAVFSASELSQWLAAAVPVAFRR